MAATAVARIDIETGGAARKLRELGKASVELGKKVGGAASKLGGLQGILGRLALAETGRRFVNMAATFKQTELRLKLLTEQYGEFTGAQELAARAGKQFGLGQTEALQGITDIYARLRPLGVSLKDIESTFVGFNTVAKLSGVSSMQASAAFTQLAQALGSGRLQGDEFRSIAEQVPGLLTAVAEETGKSVGELKGFASQGKLTSDILIRALKKVEKEGAGKIAAIMRDDPTQKFKNLQNAMETLSITIGNDLLPAVIPIINSITEFIKLINQLPGPIKTAGAAFIGFGAAFVIAAPAVAKIIGALKVLIPLIKTKFIPTILTAKAAMGPLAVALTGVTLVLTHFWQESEKASNAKTKFTKLVKEGTKEDVLATIAAKTKAIALKQAWLEENRIGGGHAGRNRRKKYREEINQLTADIEQLNARLMQIPIDEANEKLRAANKAMQALGKVTRQTSVEFKNAFATKFVKYMETVNDFGSQAAGIVIKSFQGMEDALVQFVQKGKLDFRSLANSIIADMIRMAVRAAVIQPILGSFGGFLSSVFGGGPKPTAGFTNRVAGKAAGGPVSGGRSYLVGERGPEIFTPSRSGGITPNHRMADGGTTINVSVNATESNISADGGEARQLGSAIAVAIQQQLVKERRPGGLLAT